MADKKKEENAMDENQEEKEERAKKYQWGWDEMSRQEIRNGGVDMEKEDMLVGMRWGKEKCGKLGMDKGRHTASSV